MTVPAEATIGRVIAELAAGLDPSGKTRPSGSPAAGSLKSTTSTSGSTGSTPTSGRAEALTGTF